MYLRAAALSVCVLSPTAILSQSAPVEAPHVAVLSADMGPMAQIELTWPTEFRFEVAADSRVLVLNFDRAFNAPDLGALRQRLGNWIVGIDKTASRLQLTAADDVYFNVLSGGRRLVIEMTYATGYQASRVAPSARASQRPVLTPPSAATPSPAQTAEVARPPAPSPAVRPTPAPAADNAPVVLDRKAKKAIERLRVSTETTASERVISSDRFSSEMIANARLNAEVGDRQALIEVDWATKVTLRTEQSGRELLLRLDQPVDPGLVEGLAEQMPGWLQGVSTGYDTVLLIGQPSVTFAVDHGGPRTRITLQRAAAGTTDDREPEDVRLDILRARLKARQGETGAAKEKLAELKTENPENADVLVELASIEQSVGSWRRAAGLYNQAIGLDPERRDLASARRALDREFGPQVRLDIDYQQVQDGDLQVVSVLSGRFLPTEMIDMGFSAENRFLDDDEVLRANGVTESVTVHRQRGEIYAGGSPVSGHRIEGALLASASGPGGAVRYSFRTPDSVTGVNATYNRAYWELVEGIADEGTQDRLSVRHERQFSQRWTAQGEAGVNRYGIANIDTAATTVDLSASARYLVPWEAADLSVGYSFNAQYVQSIETRIDANGNAFNPMPLTDTEFHSIDLSVGGVFLKDWRYNVFGSLSLDRFGGFGPSVGGELVWEAGEDVQLGLRAGHSRVSGRGDDAVFTRVGGHLLVRF